MKLLFIAPRYHTNQHFWIKSLIDHGHEVEFWAWNQAQWENYSVLTPKRIERLFDKKEEASSKRELAWSFPNPVWYWKNMRTFSPDIVIVRDPHAYLFAFIAVLIARIQRRKIIFYTQTPLYQRVGVAKKVFAGFATRTFRAIWITPAKGNKALYDKFHPNAFYVPFAIELSQREEQQGHAVRIISVGKLYQTRKNHLLLLQALADIRKKMDVRLTIVGALSGSSPGYLEKVKEFIAEHNLQGTVEIKTNLSHQETLAQYRKHDLFVLPSSNEPFAYSPLEAMGAGLPVMCSEGNGARWYIQEGENGYIFKSGNAEDLREKIWAVISDPQIMHDMQKKSSELVEYFYTPAIAYEKLMEAVQKV